MASDGVNNHNPEIILISSESEEDAEPASSTSSAQKLVDHSSEQCNEKAQLESSTTKMMHKNENGTHQQLEDALIIDELFEKFIRICTPLIQNAKNAPDKLIKFLRLRHVKCSKEFKASTTYLNLLNRYIRKLENGDKLVFVYINDIVTILHQHCVKNKRNIASNGDVETDVPVKKTKETPSSSGNACSPSLQPGAACEQTKYSLPCKNNDVKEDEEKIQSNILYYESLLKKLSDEIKRLQAHELSLDEMNEGDSKFIQEGQLKKRAMKVFEKLCEIKKVPVKTGRAIEQSIKLSSSRFPEVNRKIEAYINRVQKFPDFHDVTYLVKQCNKKHNLQMTQNQTETLSKNLFQEVGEKLQHRRHFDFVYNFGCYLTDPALEKLTDPSENDTLLQEKLKENRAKASTVKDVIDKYVKKQEEMNIRPASEEDETVERESYSASDPPSDNNEEESDDDTDETGGEIESDVDCDQPPIEESVNL